MGRGSFGSPAHFLARNETKRLRSRHLVSTERKRNKNISCEATADAKRLVFMSEEGMRIMRLDKYLKVSRLIKRRTVANEACDGGRVLINDKPAKASTNVKVGDVITISFGNKEVKVEVLDVQETVRKEEAAEMFKYL